MGTKYQQSQARQIAEAAIRKEAAAKNRSADLINIALEKVVAAGLELPAFSTFDTMTSTIRTEVNASICCGIHDRMSLAEQAGTLRLLEERDSDGTTQFNRLKQTAQGPRRSHFKRLFTHLEWLDEFGDTAVWVDGVAARRSPTSPEQRMRRTPPNCGTTRRTTRNPVSTSPSSATRTFAPKASARPPDRPSRRTPSCPLPLSSTAAGPAQSQKALCGTARPPPERRTAGAGCPRGPGSLSVRDPAQTLVSRAELRSYSLRASAISER
ncbi:hypothetical protein ACFV23_07220 [Streptomyces sp. NPDC059627]